MREYISFIRENGINGPLIEKIYNEYKEFLDHRAKLYQRYEARKEGVPILESCPIQYEDILDPRLKRIDDKINNQLNNPFDVDIVDTKIGYIFGNPISYVLDMGKVPNDELKEAINNFVIRTNSPDKDAETGLKAAICGYGARLLYIDPEGRENLAVVDPWEVMILAETDISEPTYAIRVYKTYEFSPKGEKLEILNAEFYDDTKTLFFKGRGKLPDQPYKSISHYFKGCPLFGVPNNSSLQGDAEKVLSLIDAYDKVMSSVTDEVEKYKLAYLVIYGYSLDEEDQENLRKNSIIEVPDAEGDVKYLTKNINDTLIENHLDRLEENILRFAKSVNFSDEAFAGNASGVAMRYKLMALENKSIIMERKFTSALRYQFKLLINSWAKRNICEGTEEEYLNIWFGFKRNLPIDYLAEAQASAQLKGLVSEKTRLSILTFVDDVDGEQAEMEAEKENIPALNELTDEDEEEGTEDGSGQVPPGNSEVDGDGGEEG